MKKFLLSLCVCLGSIAGFAQTNPTTFVNTNGPGGQGNTPEFYQWVTLEDGNPVPEGSAWISFNFPSGNLGYYDGTISIDCTITAETVTGQPGFCTTKGCKTFTYTATYRPWGYSACHVNGSVATINTVQSAHYARAGRYYYLVYDGGTGSISF